MASYKKVLVVRFSALGDVAMTVPVLYSLCNAYPDTTFVMLTRPVAAKLFVNAPGNLQIVTAELEGRHKGLRGLYTLYRDMRKLSIDGVADLHYVLRTRIISLLFRLAGFKVHHIEKGRREKKALTTRKGKRLAPLKNSIQRYTDVFEQMGFRFEQTFTSIYPNGKGDYGSFSYITPAKTDNETWIGIAPFAKHRGKIYPVNQMEEVVRKLSVQPEHKLFLFGAGEQEASQLREWCRKYPNVVSLADKRHGFLVELALISHLDCMVSMDSANMHLASLVGTPVVSIWGATHPYCGFLGWKQPYENIVQAELDCRPCSVFGDKPCYRKDYACMSAISPDTIIAKIRSVPGQKQNKADDKPLGTK